jgi:NAD(P)-dependent dehydrogenase (short-subunit alcohol dehydrogenase family)
MTTWIKGAPKVAFISGAGSGIGLQIAKALLSDGASLALFDLRVDDAVLESLRRGCCRQGQRVEVFTVDISQAASVDAAIDAAVGSFGAPDFAFNSAGILRTALFTELPAETFELVIRINLIGSRNFAAGILRYMKPGGHLALVASLAGIIGGYTQAAYGASKFGVVGLAEVLRLEQKPCGIDVSVICPGEISTPLLDHERQHGSKVTEALNATAGVLTGSWDSARPPQARVHDHTRLQSSIPAWHGPESQRLNALDDRQNAGRRLGRRAEKTAQAGSEIGLTSPHPIQLLLATIFGAAALMTLDTYSKDFGHATS